jgi:hypothetical protein
MAIAETTTGEQIDVSTPEEPSVMPMQFSESISDEVGIEISEDPHDMTDFSAPITQQEIEENVYYPGDDYPEDYSVGELIEEANSDDDARYVLMNGKKVYEGLLDIDDVVFVELEHNIKEYSSLQERIELRGDYLYFEDYIGGHSVEEVTESDALYNEWVSLQPKHIKKELELGIYRVRAYPESNDKIGCFTKTAKGFYVPTSPT